MYYIYILYSPVHQKYYVGYTHDIKLRLYQHNHTKRTTFTSKYRPWELAALFSCSKEKSEAMRIERFIKQQKRVAFLEMMIRCDTFSGVLAQLVRVPHLRD